LLSEGKSGIGIHFVTAGYTDSLPRSLLILWLPALAGVLPARTPFLSSAESVCKRADTSHNCAALSLDIKVMYPWKFMKNIIKGLEENLSFIKKKGVCEAYPYTG